MKSVARIATARIGLIPIALIQIATTVVLSIATMSCGGSDAEEDTAPIVEADTLRLTLQIDTPLQVGSNDISVVVTDANGQTVTGAAITVDLQMPMHGHGSTQVPTIEEGSDGVYHLHNVYFQMPGTWEITVTAEKDAASGVLSESHSV